MSILNQSNDIKFDRVLIKSDTLTTTRGKTYQLYSVYQDMSCNSPLYYLQYIYLQCHVRTIRHADTDVMKILYCISQAEFTGRLEYIQLPDINRWAGARQTQHS